MVATLESAWIGYSEATIPASAGAAQRRDMKRSFYAGAWALLNLQIEMAGTKEEEDGVQALEGWRKECLAFNEIQKDWT